MSLHRKTLPGRLLRHLRWGDMILPGGEHFSALLANNLRCHGRRPPDRGQLLELVRSLESRRLIEMRFVEGYKLILLRLTSEGRRLVQSWDRLDPEVPDPLSTNGNWATL